MCQGLLEDGAGNPKVITDTGLSFLKGSQVVNQKFTQFKVIVGWSATSVFSALVRSSYESETLHISGPFYRAILIGKTQPCYMVWLQSSIYSAETKATDIVVPSYVRYATIY